MNRNLWNSDVSRGALAMSGRLNAPVVFAALLGLLSGSLTHSIRLCAVYRHDVDSSFGGCAGHAARHEAFSRPAVLAILLLLAVAPS